MERKHFKCADDHWQELLVKMNKTSDEVVVSKEALEDVRRCHGLRVDARERPGLVVKDGRSKVIVNRQELFAFVQDHGEVCEKGK